MARPLKGHSLAGDAPLAIVAVGDRSCRDHRPGRSLVGTKEIRTPHLDVLIDMDAPSAQGIDSRWIEGFEDQGHVTDFSTAKDADRVDELHRKGPLEGLLRVRLNEGPQRLVRGQLDKEIPDVPLTLSIDGEALVDRDAASRSTHDLNSGAVSDEAIRSSQTKAKDRTWHDDRLVELDDDRTHRPCMVAALPFTIAGKTTPQNQPGPNHQQDNPSHSAHSSLLKKVSYSNKGSIRCEDLASPPSLLTLQADVK